MALHRSQVARILGVTETTVRRLDGSLLHPTLGADGCYEYSRDEVKTALAAFARKKRIRGRGLKSQRGREGQKAARAMMLFELGASLSDIVCELEITPGRARAWRRDWLRDWEETSRAQAKELRVDFEKTSRSQRVAAQDQRLEQNGHVQRMDPSAAKTTENFRDPVVTDEEHDKTLAEILSKTKAAG